MQIFGLLISLVIFGIFIYPLIQQLVLIKDYSDVKKSGVILPLTVIRFEKRKIVLGFIGIFFILFSFLSSGVGRIAFISVGVAYILPIIMNAFITKNCGLYSIGIIQTNEIIKFIDIERVIVKKSELVFVDKKIGAKKLIVSNNESNKIVNYLIQNNQDVIVEKEEIG